MRNRSIRAFKATLGALAILTFAAGPAWAKIDIRRVMVTGPALGAAITVEGEEAWAFLVGNRGPESSVVTAVPRDPGTAYEMTIVQGYGPDPKLSLYPFADGGAVLEIGDDEMLRSLLEWNDRPRHTGWVQVSRTQMRMLWTRGFPRTDPVEPEAEAAPDDVASPVEAAPISAIAARETGTAGTPPAGAILGAAAVLIAGMLMLRAGIRRRSGD